MPCARASRSAASPACASAAARRRQSPSNCCEPMNARVAADTVLTALRAGVAHITINRPDKRNALDRATIAALSAELQRCADDPAVRVVQLTGAGAVFCAGADLGEMQAQAKRRQADNLKDAEQ